MFTAALPKIKEIMGICDPICSSHQNHKVRHFCGHHEADNIDWCSYIAMTPYIYGQTGGPLPGSLEAAARQDWLLTTPV